MGPTEATNPNFKELDRLPLKLGYINTSIPTKWDSMTTGEFFDLRSKGKKTSFVSLIAALSNVDEDTWRNVDQDSIDRIILFQSEDGWTPLGFLKTSPTFYDDKMKETIMIDGKEYPFSEIFSPTYGQKEDMESMVMELVKDKKDPLDAIPYLVAAYYQPQITGKRFDPMKLKETVKLIREKTLIKDTYQVGNFFLLKLYVSPNEMPNTYRFSSTKKKSKPVPNHSTSLEFSLPLTLSQKETSSSMTKSLTNRMKRFFSSSRWKRRSEKSNDSTIKSTIPNPQKSN